jgi:hypothetical protein
MTVRINTTNAGGVATPVHRGLNFRVQYRDADGKLQLVFHNTASVSVKKMLEDQGVRYEDAEIELITRR